MTNRITLSADKLHVEGWNHGNRVITAAVHSYGLHEAVDKCRNYLRSWADEPSISKELQAALDASDATFTEFAFGKDYR